MHDTSQDLKDTIHRIDGRGYKAYKSLEHAYQFQLFTLFVDHVQGDPFAAPSAMRVRLDRRHTAIPDWILESPVRVTAAEDFLTRLFHTNAKRICRGIRGTGSSGLITIQKTGQEILKRSSVVLTDAYLEFRFYASLPARGRSVLGTVAETMLLKEIPDIVRLSAMFDTTVGNQLTRQVHVFEDYMAIRDQLEPKGLVAFIPNGAILPRRSGIDSRPLSDTDGPVVPFRSPESLQVTMETPHSGLVHGLGIPHGVTIIAGGGFHGKSTLLSAIERGVYGHIPLDGRELVATRPDAVKIRAEDGRSIFDVDISPFIRDLPFGKDTMRFSTENASGSTSQAANIMEALESGTRLLLIDEDTSATNFMIRDERMRKIVRKEPITPLIDVIRSLYADCGVSTIIVTGGAGDYFEVADTVILMEDYMPEDVTGKARATVRPRTVRFSMPRFQRRLRLPSAIKGHREKFVARSTHTIQIGNTKVDLQALEQISDHAQTEGIAFLLKQYQDASSDSRRPMPDMVNQICSRFESGGFVHIKRGNLAVPRRQEVMFAINRVRGLCHPETGTKEPTASDARSETEPERD